MDNNTDMKDKAERKGVEQSAWEFTLLHVAFREASRVSEWPKKY